MPASLSSSDTRQAMNTAQLAVYGMLVGAAQRGDECPSNAALAERTNISPSYAHQIIYDLAAKGWITLEAGTNARVVTIVDRGISTLRPANMHGRAADAITGAQLVAEIRAEASRRGLEAEQFAAPLNTSPRRYLEALRWRGRPGATTIARVRALIAGEPLPELPGATPVTGGIAVESLATRIERDQARLRERREAWLVAEQQRYRLPRRGRLIDEMPA